MYLIIIFLQRVHLETLEAKALQEQLGIRYGREVPSVVAVLCVVPSGGLVLHIGITSSTFPP